MGFKGLIIYALHYLCTILFMHYIIYALHYLCTTGHNQNATVEAATFTFYIQGILGSNIILRIRYSEVSLSLSSYSSHTLG